MSRARTPRQKVLFAGFGFIPVAFLFLPKEIDHLGRLENGERRRIGLCRFNQRLQPAVISLFLV